MSRAKPDACIAGFSLIEAMAAVALTATIIMLLSSVTGQWLPNWRRGFVDLQRADLLAIGLERMVQDISAAEYVTPSARRGGAVVRRRRNVCDFRAVGDRPGLLSSSRSCAYRRGQGRSRPRDDPNPGALRAASAGRPCAAFRFWRPGRAYSGAVSHLVRLRRAGPCLGRELERAKSACRTPCAITVRDAAAGNRAVVASTAVSMKVTAQGVPKLEAQASAASAPPSAATPAPGAAGPEPQQ